MTAQKQNFQIYQGDDENVLVTVYEADGTTPSDLTGAVITWEMRRSEASPDPAILDKDSSSGGGITISDQGTNPGQFVIEITDTDSADLVGLYWHKAVCLLANNTTTVLTGIVTVIAVGTITPQNSYGTVEGADEYWGQRNNIDWNQSDPVDKEAWLLEAMDYLHQTYVWEGAITDQDQPLDWPRYGVYDKNFRYIDSDVVPPEIIEAQYILANYSRQGPLLSSNERATKREKVDVIEVEYFEGSSQNRSFPDVSRLLAPFTIGSAAGINVKLLRA